MGERLSILVYTETQGQVGGSTAFLADLIPRLDASRFDVAVLGNPDPDRDAYLSSRVPGLRLYTVNVRVYDDALLVRALKVARAKVRRGGSRPAPSAGTTIGASSNPTPSAMQTVLPALVRYPHVVMNGLRILRALRRLRPDVMHINNGGYPGGHSCRAAAVAAKLARIPVVFWVHSMPIDPAMPALVERAVDTAVKWSTTTWVTGARSGGRAMTEKYSVNPKRVDVVRLGRPEQPSPTTSAPIERPHGAVMLATVGALVPMKGHHVLLNAVRQMLDRGMDVGLLVVGTGPAEAALRSQVADLALSDRVSFLGWREDVPLVLRSADIYVHPSLYEQSPYVIKEAMQASLPVVATRVGAVDELVLDGTTGLLVEPSDADALAERIGTVASNRALAASLATEGRRRVREHFSLEGMVTGMERVYQHAALTRA